VTNPLLFLLAALTLVAVPGPNHLYITTRSIGEGRRAGVASALGVETGMLVHIAAAAAGLSAVVAASATAFGFLRYAGAAYLVYLAYRTLRSSDRHGAKELRPQPIHRVYLDGALVNVLNPKVVLFFLAFLPQFVDRDAGAVPLQIAVMGLVTALIGLVSDIGYALAAGTVGDRLRARSAFRWRRRYLTSLIYLALGAATLIAAPTPRRA
jgi:threonine/homoserine/homoserine lactone efflux protein